MLIYPEYFNTYWSPAFCGSEKYNFCIKNIHELTFPHTKHLSLEAHFKMSNGKNQESSFLFINCFSSLMRHFYLADEFITLQDQLFYNLNIIIGLKKKKNKQTQTSYTTISKILITKTSWDERLHLRYSSQTLQVQFTKAFSAVVSHTIKICPQQMIPA